MPITTAVGTPFKVEMLNQMGLNTTGADVYRLALYTSSANLDATTAAYTASGEATGTGYTARGTTLTNLGTGSGGTTAFASFSDVTFATSSISAAGCMIFNETKSDICAQVHSFGGTVTSVNGDFNVTFPTNNSTDALIRLV